MWIELGVALSLVFIIEGILPFLYPRLWRDIVAQAAALGNAQLRIVGLISMLSGLALLSFLR